MVICKEDGAQDDQNQGGGGARIVANDHPDDPTSSVLLHSFANDHLQKGRFSRWPKSRRRRSRNCCKWSSGWSGLLRAPPFLCKWSFAKRTVLRMTKIKGMDKHGMLQMTIWMIRPPSCSSVLLQMVICKEDGPLDDQQFFGRMGLKFAPDLPPSMEDPQYKISAQTDQRFRS